MHTTFFHRLSKNKGAIAIPLALLAMATIACTGEKKPLADERITEVVDSTTGVIALRDYVIDDTITIKGNVYNYTCTFEHIDTMPIVINSQGLEYYESRVRIDVRHNDTQLFNRTFYKNNFRNLVPDDFLRTSTMVGVNYNVVKREEDRSALYFIVSVGDPDESADNMTTSFELKVDTNGSHTLSIAENLETSSLNPDLNIDPDERQ